MMSDWNYEPEETRRSGFKSQCPHSCWVLFSPLFIMSVKVVILLLPPNFRTNRVPAPDCISHIFPPARGYSRNAGNATCAVWMQGPGDFYFPYLHTCFHKGCCTIAPQSGKMQLFFIQVQSNPLSRIQLSTVSAVNACFQS